MGKYEIIICQSTMLSSCSYPPKDKGVALDIWYKLAAPCPVCPGGQVELEIPPPSSWPSRMGRQSWGSGSALCFAVVHFVLQVPQVVRDGGTEAEETGAVVAVWVLPGAVTHKHLETNSVE